MLTLTDLLFKIILPVTGLAMGIGIGNDYLGFFGGIVGAIAGMFLLGYIGMLFNRFFLTLSIRAMRKKFAPFSVSELRDQLGTSLTPNYVLLELKFRGEDISHDIEPVLGMLEAKDSFKRTRGYAALLSAFPERAISIREYNPMRSVSECHQSVMKLRNQIQGSHT